MNGYIKLHRKILEWGWYKDPFMLRVFLHLLLTANFKPNQWMGHTIERGQVVVGRENLSKNTGISPQTIRTCLTRLKSTKEITIKSTNRFSIITICNYDTYQDESCEINQQNNQPSNQQLTSSQPAVNQQLTTTEEGKESIERDSGPVCAPPGFPRTEDEAAACAEMAGVPRTYSITLYHEVLGRGYKDMNGHPVVVWRSFAKGCWDRRVSNTAEKKASGQPANGKATAFTLKTQLDAVQAGIDKIKVNSPQEDGRPIIKEIDRSRWDELVATKRRIVAQLERLT